MKNLDLWAGRLPIGRAVEAILFAALIALALVLLPIGEARADVGPQADLELARASLARDANAKFDAIGDCMKHGKDSQAQTTCVLSVALLDARAPVMIAPQAAAPAPTFAAVPQECVGFITCLVSGTKAVFGGVRDVVQAVAPLVGPYYGYRGQVVQAEYQKVAAVETTKQVQAREGTTQAMSRDAAGIATGGFTALSGPRIVASGTGINFGSGDLLYQSQNPISTVTNPAARTCLPTFSATGTVTGWTGNCSGP